MRKLILVIMATLLLTPAGYAKEIAGVDMPNSLTIGKDSLVLNGAGIRRKMFLNLYVGGLYLGKANHDPRKIIGAEEPMAIRLHIISSLITSKKMEKATVEGFENSTSGNLAPIELRMQKFISVFKEKIQKNDIFDLLYTPGKGIEIYKNNRRFALIEGLDFKKALFGIWLGKIPAQKDLKKQMLGK